MRHAVAITSPAAHLRNVSILVALSRLLRAFSKFGDGSRRPFLDRVSCLRRLTHLDEGEARLVGTQWTQEGNSLRKALRLV